MKRTRKQLQALKARQMPTRRDRNRPHSQLKRERSIRALPYKLNVAIGEAITSARIRKGIGQKDLALRVPGLYEAQAIYGMERGIQAPSMIQLRAIARALGVTIHSLVPEYMNGK